MLSKLALRNVKRQVGNYLIYFITVAFTVAMLFSVSNIIFSENLARFTASDKQLQSALIGFVVLISTIVAFVLSYATSFMLRLRKREFGTYLTLGMTRKNILSIFIAETTVIVTLALVLGLALGLFIYQGLSAVMMNLLEMEFDLAAYSAKGFVMTVCLVVGIFLLASLTSAVYLKKVSIYDLIHGDKKVEKTVRHPAFWLSLTVIFLFLIVGSLVLFDREVHNVIMNGAPAAMTIVYGFIFAISIPLFHIGLARSVIYLFLKHKKLCAKSTNTFVLRQLSGTLNTNSMMLGCLAFLLTFAVIGANLAFVQKASQEMTLNDSYPYDIKYTRNTDFESTDRSGNDAIPVNQAETLIKKYTDIKNKYECNMYNSQSNEFYSQTKWTGDGYEGSTDSFMKLSDFNKLIEPLGYDEIRLDNEFMIVAAMPEVESVNWQNVTYNRGGKSYKFHSIRSDFPLFAFVFFYVVIPDEAVNGMSVVTNYVFYDTDDAAYDAYALKKDLTYLTPSEYYNDGTLIERCDYSLREFGRQQQNSSNAILVIGALFASTVFVFMAMAILALKTLSTLSDDKQRYAVLRRLGAGYREQGRTLFRQTFGFFMLPFAVPLIMSIPVAIICNNIIELANMTALSDRIPVIAVTTAGVMTAVYLLYYAVTYLIAKRTIIQK